MESTQMIKMLNSISGIVPKEGLIDLMEKAIAEWRSNKSDKNFGHIAYVGTIISMRDQNDQIGQTKVLDMIDEVEKAHTIMDQIRNFKNQ